VATTPNGLYYPALSDSPNGPSQMQTAALALDHKVIGNFATAAARSAAITAPVLGDLTYRVDAPVGAEYEKWNGSAWEVMYGIWRSYTPALTATTTNPTQGNSTYAGGFTLIGKTIHYRFLLTIGSTFSVGSGAYVVSLPATAAANEVGELTTGYGHILNSSARKPIIAFGLSSTTVRLVRCSNETSVDNTGPGAAWATGNTISIHGTFEST
jgi:hypothetical protein